MADANTPRAAAFAAAGPRDFAAVMTRKLRLYFLKLQVSGFVPVPNAAPPCGAAVS
jgi:hypothetical protein